MCIPHGLRTMYVHAYQSYLWNAATSERCLKHGTKSAVQGDLVLPDDSPEAEEEHHANGEQVLPLVEIQVCKLQQDSDTLQKPINGKGHSVIAECLHPR